jgi:hypothetical protein
VKQSCSGAAVEREEVEKWGNVGENGGAAEYCGSVVTVQFCNKDIVRKMLIKGTVAQDFLASVFLWIYFIWAPDFDANRIFFSFSFSRSYRIFR